MASSITRQACQAMDQNDPLAGFINRFQRSKKHSIFLDANSLGAMPATVPSVFEKFCLEEWTEERSQAWATRPWIARPTQIGAALAPLIGARPEDVLAGDSTTVNLFKLLSYAWRVRRSGSQILTDSGNFPTDLYVAEGLERALADAPKPVICDSRSALLEKLGEQTAVVYLSHVDYRSSERWDMAEINRLAHAAGALTVWDLSHSAGAIPLDLMGSGADFAIGCGYKYLSGGPGGPAYLWIHPDHANTDWPTICGWMGHSNIFAFAEHFEPIEGISRQAAGTPNVVANEVFACAANIWKEVDPAKLWAKHRGLSELLVDLLEQECGQLGVTLVSPAEYDQRGGHICFSHDGGEGLCAALNEAGVICSFRRPNALRFGIGALYLSFEDMWEAVARLKQILEQGRWQGG